MINTAELRKGNYISVKGQIVQVTGIWDDGGNSENEGVDTTGYSVSENVVGSGASAKDTEPIPLTPEILGKCGFENNNFYYSKTSKSDSFEIFEISEIGGTGKFVQSVNCDEYHIGREIDSLHHLQNAYFSHTGEELTYKP